jgi:hypothetical protein
MPSRALSLTQIWPSSEIAEAVAACVYGDEMRRASGLPEVQDRVSSSFACLRVTFVDYAQNHHGGNVPVTANLVFSLRHWQSNALKSQRVMRRLPDTAAPWLE